MTDRIQTAIADWSRLVNAGEYFEAHEVLEGPWLQAREPERTFLKGLIHVAVALHHYQRGNGHGARVKYQSAVRYLQPYGPDYLGVCVSDLLAQLQSYFSGLVALPRGAAPPPNPATLRVKMRSPRH